MYHIDFDLASKTSKKDIDVEESYHHAQPQQAVVSLVEQVQFDEVMNKLPMKLHETAEDFEPRRTQMRKDFLASSSRDQIQHYVRFLAKLIPRQSVLHQVSPSVECHLTQAQRANADTKRRICVLYASELPPNHVNFTNRFFQMFWKKQTKTWSS